MEKLEIVALSHDLGKVFDRKNHQKKIVEILKRLGVRDKEIISSLEKFHQPGTGKEYLYLVKYADRYSSRIQRVNTEGFNAPQGEYWNYLKKIFLKELSFHIRDYGLHTNTLLEFIRENQVLEQIPSDVRDIKKVSLRKHSILTYEIFCLLLNFIEIFPPEEPFCYWVRYRAVRKYLRDSVRRIPDLNVDDHFFDVMGKFNDSVPLNSNFRRAVAKLKTYGWGIDKIALHFDIPEGDVKEILNS